MQLTCRRLTIIELAFGCREDVLQIKYVKTNTVIQKYFD